MDVLARLSRKDKWFLGGGRGAIYAPPFPKHLLAPGFWDDCYFADIRVPRLFTVLFADRNGRPLDFTSSLEGWRPDCLTILHRAGGVAIRERRCVTDENAWVSEFELLASEDPIHVFLWSLPPVAAPAFGAPWQSVTDAHVQEDSIRITLETAWPAELEPDRTGIEQENIRGASEMGKALALFLEYGASVRRHSWTVNLAQRHDDSPLYALSVLPEKFKGGKLPGDFKLFVGTEPYDGYAHVVQHYVLQDRAPLTVACGAGLTPDSARRSLEAARQTGAPERSERSWKAFFASVPQFDSSDEYLTNAYWYRWYGLRLNTVDILDLPCGEERFAPFVTEGVGFFRNFVTYSAQAHLREVSWMHDPALAIGILDNLAKVQREDGSYPGHNYSCRPSRDFYHADFATGTRQVHALHPGSIGKDHLGSLRRYADYFLRHRTLSNDPASATLYDVFDQNETGQEYMSRYQFASENADKWASFRVSGVDASVYAYELFRMLAEFRPADSPYARFADGAFAGLRDRSWDRQSSYFCDVRPDGAQSPARPATGLYPLMIDRVRDLPVAAMVERWTDEFFLPAGFPATAESDPTFSAEGEWKERRLNCPWNGRSWPMANSHLVDGFANFAREVAPSFRQKAGEGLMKAIRLMFHEGDPRRPNSYEHYDPLSGVPALYRGYDDYMHSWIVDLILRHAVGIKPGRDEVDPLPLGIERIECSEIPHPNGRMHVRITGGEAKVEVEHFLGD